MKIKMYKMNLWEDKKVIVTGGVGFLGSYVIKKLRERGFSNIFILRSKNYDLTKEKNVIRLDYTRIIWLIW